LHLNDESQKRIFDEGVLLTEFPGVFSQFVSVRDSLA
jgi:hypothetical protein